MVALTSLAADLLVIICDNTLGAASLHWYILDGARRATRFDVNTGSDD